jgi:guanylate kinase
MPDQPGLLFILVAPAGAGKNSLMNIVLKDADSLRQLPTATTRAIREGEQHGREHLFLTRDAFEQMIAADALIEWQEVHGRLYGVPRATVDDALAAEDDLIADIEFKGAAILREQYRDNTILIFVQPPSADSLIDRMRQRGENEAAIGHRLMRVPEEMTYAEQCDYLIHNDDIEHAAAILRGIVLAEQSRRNLNKLRASGSSQHANYRLVSAAIALYDDQILVQGGSFPSVPLQDNEQPYTAALRALREKLELTPAVDQLIGQRDADFIAPIYVDSQHQDAFEQVTMHYGYRMSQQFDPPAGWRWQPLAQSGLPTQLIDALSGETILRSNE